jgi:pyruvate formate lyase activating enzyme
LSRIPLIPDITARESNLRGLAGFLRRLGVRRARQLPYNPMWIEKLAKTGMTAAANDHPALKQWMTCDEIRGCEAVFRDAGIAV